MCTFLREVREVREVDGFTATHRKVKVSYADGGYNSHKGAYVHFSEINKDGVFESTILMANSSFKILVAPMNRKSKKKTELAEKLVEENIDTIFKYYDEVCDGSDTAKAKLAELLHLQV